MTRVGQSASGFMYEAPVRIAQALPTQPREKGRLVTLGLSLRSSIKLPSDGVATVESSEPGARARTNQ